MEHHSMQALVWITLFGLLHFLPGASLNAIDTPANTSVPTSTDDFRTKTAERTTRRTPSLGLHHAEATISDDRAYDDATAPTRTQSTENFVSPEAAGSAEPSPTQITSTNAPRTLHGEHNGPPPTTKQTSAGKTFARQVGIAETSYSAAMTTNSYKDDESAAVDDHGHGDEDDNNNVAGSKGIKDLFNAIADGGEAEQQIMLATMDATQKPWPTATTSTNLRTTMTIAPMNGSADITTKKEDAGTFGTLRYTSAEKKADEAHTKSVVGKVRYSNKKGDIHSVNAPAHNFGADKRLPELVMESIAIDAAKNKERLGMDEKSTNGTTQGMFTAGATWQSPIQNVNFDATTEGAAEVTVNLEQASTGGLPDELEDGQTPVTALKRAEVEFIRETTMEIGNTQLYKEPQRVAQPPIIPEEVSVLQIPSISVTLAEPPKFEEQPTTSRNAAGMLALPIDTKTTAGYLSTAKSLKTTPADWATTSKGISSGSLEPRTNGEASSPASLHFEAATAEASVKSSPTTFKPSPPMATVATTARTQTIHPESEEMFETIGQPEKLVATLMPAPAETSAADENNGSGGSTVLRSLNDKDNAANLNGHGGETAATTQRPDAEEQEEYVAIAVDVGGTYEYPARLVQQPKIVYSNSNRIGNLHHQQQLEQEGRPYDSNTDAAGPTEHMTWQQGREYVKQLHAAIAAAASGGDSDRTTMRHDLLSLPVPAQGTSRLHPTAGDNNNNPLITTKASTPATLHDTATAERRPAAQEAISGASAPPSTQPTPAEASTMALPTLPKTTKRRIVVRTTTAKPPPTIDDYQTITSQAGTHAFLPCNVKQLVKKPISWLRMRDGHILTVDQTTFIADERFQSVFSSNPERWSLQIKYVKAKDAGTYECQVSTEPKASAIVNLRIVEPRTEIIGESTRHVKAGSQVKLHCIISQALEPPISINWFYNQKQIYLNNRKGWHEEIESIDLPPAPPQTTTPAPTTTTLPPTTITTTARTDMKASTQLPGLKRFPSAAAAPSSSLSDPTTPTSMRVPGSAGGFAATAPTLLASEPDGATRAFKDSTPPPTHARSASSPLTVSPPSLTHELTNDVDLLDPDDLSSASAPASPFGDPHRGGGVTAIAAAAAMAAAAASAAAAANVVDVRQITTATLIIPSVEKQDSGNYTCSPSNSAPRTVVLHVLNGEYSASAITSGAGSLHMQRPLISQRRGFHQRLLRWPNIYSILVLCGFLNILLAHGCTDSVWKLSSLQRGQRGLHVISSNYAHEADGAIIKPKNGGLICQPRERILCGTFGEEYT